MEIFRACTPSATPDLSGLTATAADIVAPKTALTADGEKTGLIGTDIFTINANKVAVTIWDVMYAIYNSQTESFGYEGSLDDLPNLPAESPFDDHMLFLFSCPNLTGNISNIPDGTYSQIYISDAPLITGDLSTLPDITTYLDISDCSLISGVLSPTASLLEINLLGTAMTANDIDQTLINLASATEVSQGFIGVPTGRTTASDDAVSSLQALEWYIQ